MSHIPAVQLPKPAPLKAVASSAAAPSVRRNEDPRPVPPKTATTKTVATQQDSPPRPAAAAAGSSLGRVTADELQSANAFRPPVLPELTQVLAIPRVNTAQKAACLRSAADIVAKCQRCELLAAQRKQTVFGVGNPDARIMFVGEAPGAEEDARGEPFVGPAGQLLDRIVTACKLRREDLYICNILRCRPPGNRNPLPQEAANCREFLDAQIQIVRPEFIICWGTVAAQNLLSETRPVGKLRGQFFDYQGIRVLCTYHPSYLLRNPSAKKQVWDDMKFFMKELGVELD